LGDVSWAASAGSGHGRTALAGWQLAVYLDRMKSFLPRLDVKAWLRWVRAHVPFMGRDGGNGLAGVREPRRPRPPTKPPQARSAEPEGEGFYGSSVATLSRDGRHRWWRRTPRAEQA
jgi:hypothetical protein